MNVYDFDHTIYRGDSTVDFWLFCLRRHPPAWRCLSRQLAAAARCAAGRMDKTAMKQAFFSFLTRVPDVQAEVLLFWDRRERRVEGWYRKERHASDVVISASPEFLLAPICARLGVRLVASRVDPATGRFDGSNCRGEEKVARFRKMYGDAPIGRFYSDSRSDAPMAALAREAFLVRRGKVEPWP